MLVQFSDSNKTEIIAYLAGPQDTEDFPNQGEIEADDPKWAVFLWQSTHVDGLPEPIRNKA
ncbi:TPA: hypothetical protein U5E37_002700 [Yersinia enterocolitica]|nr:hypothetical protein [Yersinia enterocolitica]HEN3630557.1 hypothetical protein [Yersinia enterocolitica]HEN3654740.1 hypothetical protein [Yersinia enterocolitica]HEN3662041.1 hypothetical protein [Yersinia enterocolitica]HEN3672553.1 hypothetical protein [Yersinia enterocolitica]